MTTAFAQASSGSVSEPTPGVSNPTSGNLCPNETQSCGGASQQLLDRPVSGAAKHMGFGVALVLGVVALYVVLSVSKGRRSFLAGHEDHDDEQCRSAKAE
jgi:hypothetical protein